MSGSWVLRGRLLASDAAHERVGTAEAGGETARVSKHERRPGHLIAADRSRREEGGHDIFAERPSETHHYGRLLEARRLERGEAPQVPLAAEATDVRVMVGSHLDGEARFLAELNQCGGIERHRRVDLNAGPTRRH